MDGEEGVDQGVGGGCGGGRGGGILKARVDSKKKFINVGEGGRGVGRSLYGEWQAYLLVNGEPPNVCSYKAVKLCTNS